MEDMDRGGRKWKTLKERLGFVGLGCCVGPTWGSPDMLIREEQEDEGQEEQMTNPAEEEQQTEAGEDCFGDGEVPPTGMNLATALAAERTYRTTEEEMEAINVRPATATPGRVSLMRLLEESDGADEEEKGSDTMCCVCMGRKKGAAFIPCGHTFCRVCSREIWLNRGSCPLCNKTILEILDLF